MAPIERTLRFALSASMVTAMGLLSACSQDGPEDVISSLACHSGAWRASDGTAFVLTPTTDGGMRYRLLDGRSGRLSLPPGATEATAHAGWLREGPAAARATFRECGADDLRFSLVDGPQGVSHKLPLRSDDIGFDSGDLRLRGRLVRPAGASGPLPLAVLVHGSERYSAVDINPLQYMLPAQGIAVFVYDKRGTGQSGGEYTQDFDILAGDAIAAMEAARRTHPGGFVRTGYVGGSQGGWIAPLAASRSQVDYVVALYGLAESALAEDREQVANDLRARGHGEDVVAKAREVSDATALLMKSGFTQGFDALAAARAKYGGEPWFSDIRGEFSGEVIGIPEGAPQWIIRRLAMRRDVGTSWNYEPLPVLEALDVPQLWVIAGDDLEAPPAETLRRIRTLQSKEHPVDLAVFPRTDHGIYEYVEKEGIRTPLRHPDGYFRLIADWIARPGALANAYGTATVERHAAPAVPADPP